MSGRTVTWRTRRVMSQHSHILVEGGDRWGPPDRHRLRRQAGGEGGKQGIKEAGRGEGGRQEVKEASRGLIRQAGGEGGRQGLKEASGGRGVKETGRR